MIFIPGENPGKKPMPQKLMDVLMLGRCSHEFSWPRRAADGHYYQVCLLCTAEYKYDWKAMKRIKRVDGASEASAETKKGKNQKKPTWVPRARRLTLQTPVRYRPKGLGTWHEGTVENLSQSGVLLFGPQQLPDNTLVEMVFEMPEEISGQKNSTVLCQGRIIRRKDIRDEELVGLAASILDYKFLRNN
jgi:hypothetical protein